MTDMLNNSAPAHEPHGPERRNSNRIVFAMLAAVAITVLVVVAILAPIGDDGHSSMMTSGQMPGSMMSNDQMMPGSMMSNGQMMNGSMMSNGQMMDGSMSHAAPSATVIGAREVQVSSRSFSFTPDEIHVRAGEDVTIVLAAADIAHDFTIDELNVHVAAAPGQTGRGGLHAPSNSGRYTAYCSVAGHRSAGMTATVVVDSD